MKVSKAFAAPTAYWWAIVEEARQRQCAFRLDRAWARGVAVGVQRGLAPHEQASPLTVPVLRLLGAVASTAADFTTILGLLCAMFTLVRVESFLTLGPVDVHYPGGREG